MLKRWNWMMVLAVVLAAFWGCSSDDSVTTPVQTQSAFTAMAAAAEPYINNSGDCPGVMSAQALYDNLADYTVIDIRSQADYDAGHILGAYHSTLPTLIADLENTIPTTKPYVVACYTGQSAGHAKIAMELLGYGDVYTLGFGMASWNTTLAPR
jgi:rhodanese-related sulfurtransferase